MSRHFPYQHPLFGSPKRPLPDSYRHRSVYFWWFEYLRRNEEYRLTCQNGGTGSCSDLFEDFGDIYDCDFKTWWQTGGRGVRLFAEPQTDSIKVISKHDINQTYSDQNSLLLSVPLDLPITFLVKAFRDIVSKHHTGKRGQRHNAKSNAKYKVFGKVDVLFLQIALQVWDTRQSDPTKPLWQIGNELRLGSKQNILKSNEINDINPEVRDKKNILAVTTSRYVKKAQNMIERTGQGRFPN